MVKRVFENNAGTRFLFTSSNPYFCTTPGDGIIDHRSSSFTSSSRPVKLGSESISWLCMPSATPDWACCSDRLIDVMASVWEAEPQKAKQRRI